MTAENLPTILVSAMAVLVAGSVLYLVLKHGGIKAAMFGAPIAQTVGEVKSSGAKLFRLSLRVHKLNGGPKRSVGVEMVAKSFASYQMLPVALSTAEARRLIALLEAATTGAEEEVNSR